MNRTLYVYSDEYYQNKAKYENIETMFGANYVPSDLNYGIVQEKQTNGLEPNVELLNKTQDCIRDRFQLETANDNESY